MTLPGALLAFIIASAVGLLFHLLRGGGVARIGLFLATAWISFFSGHYVGEWLDLHILRLGSLNLFAALFGTLLGLFTASLLAGPSVDRRGRPGSKRNRAEDPY